MTAEQIPAGAERDTRVEAAALLFPARHFAAAACPR